MKFISNNFQKNVCHLTLHEVTFSHKGDTYKWSQEGTGNRSGNDHDMRYEFIFKLYKNNKLITNETRYVSEYSDASIELQNTCRFLQPEQNDGYNVGLEDWGDVIKKMYN